MTFVQFYYDPITEFDRLFGDAFAGRACPAAGAARRDAPRDVYRPRLDLHESKEDGSSTVTATFELPGLTSDDVTVDVHQNRLTVSGELVEPTVSEGEEQRYYYVVRERRYGKFSRTLQLPSGTKPEDVKAKMENGILTITFPKSRPEQEARRVAVQ